MQSLHEQFAAACEGQDVPLDEGGAVELFTRAWKEMVPDRDPFDALYVEEGSRVLARAWQGLVQAHGQARTQRLAHQATVEVEGREIRLDIDRLERAAAPPGQPAATRLIRHRVGGARTVVRPDMRALLYTLAHRQQAPSDPYELEVHDLSNGERYPLRLNARKEESLRRQLRETLDGIDRGDYRPRPDPRTCGGCPFLFICPA